MEERIKLIRKYYGLNQTQFAEKLGLSRNHIAQVETGKGKFSERTIKDICRIWNVNEDWLKSGEGEMFLSHNAQVSELLADVVKGNEPFLESFIDVWISLDGTSKEALKRIAIAMGEKLKEREK